MIIHAASINVGGGKILLDQLLTEKTFGEVRTLICDTRYSPPKEAASNLEVIFVQPTLVSRWNAERILKNLTNTTPNQTVLCFSNLPPAFNLNAKVILYLQNALLLPNVPFYFNSLRFGLKILYEKFWLNFFWKNLDEVWVQTRWMKEALGNKKTPIFIKPIIPTLPTFSELPPKIYDFVTVSGHLSHKRLDHLLKAWKLMPAPAPSLLVITDKYESRFKNLDKKNITFKVDISQTEVFKSYLESKNFILTSELESFCLPIYEALHFKLKIIVPDEKYAKEACTADLIINPKNIPQMQKKIERFFKKTLKIEVPLKILNVNMTIDSVNSGGTGERTVQMSKALSTLGHKCSILTLNLGITKERKDELKNINLVALPCLSKRFYIPLPDLYKISNLVKEAEIIHLMGHWAPLNAIVYIFIRKYNKKYIVCPAGALPLFGRSKIIKLIYNFFIGKRIIKNADSHFAITNEEIPQFRAYGVLANSIARIPNGIDPSALQEKNDQNFREKFGIGSSPFIFYIGRLNPIKGPDLLLKAFCSLKDDFPEFKLVMAGPDEGMLTDLKKIAREYKMNERIHFIGHVSGNIKSQALHAATLMVIPSRLEAMSIVVLEAGVIALPVLLTDRCGLNSLKSIDAGIIVPPTIEGIREGLFLNLRNTENLLSMGKRLQIHVYDNYLWRAVAKTIEAQYKTLINNS